MSSLGISCVLVAAANELVRISTGGLRGCIRLAIAVPRLRCLHIRDGCRAPFYFADYSAGMSVYRPLSLLPGQGSQQKSRVINQSIASTNRQVPVEFPPRIRQLPASDLCFGDGGSWQR